MPFEYSVEGTSLIDFEMNLVQGLPETDWIFFTSKNSVHYFFKQFPGAIGNRKLAAIGKGTLKALYQYVPRVDFNGDAVDIKSVGLQFSREVGNETCLFPISNISKRTVQNFFNDPEQVKDLIVYRTQAKKGIIQQKEDILIFTSPSNVEAYFQTNALLSYQSVIAMGYSTKKQLESMGIKKVYLPKSTGEIGLIDEIMRIGLA